ncbi:non-ribosomal peptide synthetase [Dictyobacter aurantiacus]|uniref:Carrier domain-containing protein n=1 Tax=Dictyobacter aurantiacus TaxID=1936993 RepID=A0A401ZKM9_9CHLR|nr:non-ribosomal peptide synthetase [Dictyobacter aurantiacus]GCE07388.1 hypothetical protein KDAU_47170 [Dictyobacter aurantiacus]
MTMEPNDYNQEQAFSEQQSELLALLLAEEGFSLSTRPPLTRGSYDAGEPIALAYEQEPLWFLAQLEPGNPFYNVPVMLRLDGPLQQEALRASLNALLARHESLRTSFHERAGQPFQAVEPELTLDLPLLDLSTRGGEARREALRLAVRREADTPFDLRRAPLVRARLVRCGPEEHYLLFTAHHLVFDGWSLGVFFRELKALYGALVAGEPPALPPLPIQYADYARWQRGWLQGEALAEELAFWRQEVDGAATFLDLPTTYPRTGAPGFQGASQEFAFSSELTEQLKALARQEDCTLYMLLLAGLEVLLSRYSCQEDFLLGTPMHTRRQEETEGLIGMLVNTLVVRADVRGEPSGRQLLRRVRERLLGVQSHADLPLEELVKALNPERAGSATPLVQVVFAWEDLPPEQQELGPGLSLHIEPWVSHSAKFELTVLAWETPDGIRGQLEYNTALHDGASMIRLIEHWRQLLHGLVSQPERPVQRLDLLTPQERQRQIVDWNQTRQEFPAERTVCGLIEEQARTHAQAPAVSDAQEALSYQELNERANRLAHYLREQGVGPEVRVGACLPRSVKLVVSLLAIWKAGGAYVPLDPGYPRERLTYMLSDAGAQLVLTGSQSQENLRESDVHVLYLDQMESELALYPTLDVEESGEASNLAYIVYTSGSTGAPKGVQVTQRNIMQLAYHPFYTPVAPGDRVGCASSVAFDALTFEVWATLAHGAHLICLDQDTILQPGALARALREQQVSNLFLTTALVNQVAQQEPGAFSLLRSLSFGGEAVEPRWIRAILRAGAPQRLVHMYGPAECTTYALFYHVDDVAEGDVTIPIGRPIGNTRAYVLDAYQQLVPPGVVGELYLGGEGVTRGYLNQPALTTERFVPDPWSDRPGARLYRTGDLVRAREDGALIFVGREDGQVKLRGNRIEVGEIESRLLRHPAVRAATVLLREDRPGEKRLVAYLVGQDEQRPTPAEIRAYAREQLPEYMLPSAVVWLEQLPLTPNGKVDKRALPAPGRESEEAVSEEQLPRPGREMELAAIWSQVLGVEQIGREANFFDLGGHSLLATQLISRVRDAFNIELPLRTLFEAPTLAAFAAQLGTSVAGDESQRSLIPRVAREGQLRPSFSQERFWFLNQLDPQSTAYNMPVAYRLSGQLRLDVLRRSLAEIIRRHESLRTTFVEEDGVLLQRISPQLELALPEIDLTGLPADEWEAEVQRRLTGEARQPFDLQHGPLLRATLLRLDTEEHVLFLNMHHIISDGWSLSVFSREFTELYRAYAQDRPSPLAELSVQYADYASWQRDLLRGQALDEQLSYWKEQLADRPPALELPIDYPRGATQNFEGAGRELLLPPELADRLKALSQRQDGTLFMTLLAAFAILLGRYSGQDDLLVGVPIAGRTRPEFEELVGLFLNTLVLRVRLEDAPTFTELLARVREATLGAYAHQDLPFEYLVEVLQPERHLNRNPLYEVMLNLVNLPQSDLSLPELRVSSVELSEPEAKLPITLYIYERQDGLLVQLVYQRALFSDQRMRLLLNQFQVLLEQIADEPGRVVDSYSLLTPASRHLIPDPTVVLPEPYCEPITNLIKVWASDPRDLVAVWQAGRQWSYRELIERADVIARTLVKLGIRRGDAVAIQGTRSFGLYATLVGTLMSGGVLLTLERSLPLRRQEIMAHEADARYLVRIDAHADEDLGELGTLGSFVVDSLSGMIVGESEEDLRAIELPEIMQDDAAYLVFTSGTTGVPKGVLGRHKSLSHFLSWQRSTFEMGPGDRCAQMALISFDMFWRDVFMPLVSGATLYLPEEYAELMPERILPWLAREGITSLHIVPTMAQSWLNDERFGMPLPAMRRVFFAGEPLPDRLVQRWRAVFGREGTILNLYGPAETTLAKSCYWVPEDDMLPGIQPAGWPLPEAQMLVMGRGGQLCGIGEPGEIVIRTPFRSLGYVNVSEENRRRFLKNPFRDDERDVLYRSGDRGRYALDGKLEILGRVDEQVKIRGVRVEPPEIEMALQQHPAIKTAVVRAYTEPGESEKRLAVYMVPLGERESTPTEPELRRFLRATLPEYMVPSAFIWLEELPLTRNGKLDWRALPVPEATVAASEHYSAPRTLIEEQVVGIWAQVLKRPLVGIHDNFFELGGHSLLGVQIISRLREACQVEVPLRALFEAQTVAALAERIEQLRAHEQSAQARAITRVDRRGELPLSFPQQRLWFLDQWEPNNPFFNVSRLVEIQGPLDVDLLKRCLNEIVRRHEALRTIIVARQGRPSQVILPELHLEVEVVDLEGLPEGERAAEKQRQAQQEARRPFDLSRGPLIRARLLRLGEVEHVLSLTVHHIVSDAWSLSVLLRELGILYDAWSEDERSQPLAELPVQYVDFTLWQSERLRDVLDGATLMERQLAYWREHLRGAPPMLSLPSDRPRPPLQTFRGAQYPFTVPDGLTAEIKELARREGVTLSMTMLAAFQTLLYRYTGQADLVIGSTNANRTHVEIENLIGCFFDIQALRTSLAGDPTFRELLGRVREVALGAYTNQDLPFGKIVEELQPERSLSYPPYFQVAFSLQHMPVMTLDLARIRLRLLDIDTGSARLDLMIFLWEHEQQMVGTIEYNTDLFDASTIGRFIAHYRRLLEGIVEQPEQCIGSLPLLPEEELSHLLGDWSCDGGAALSDQMRQRACQALQLSEEGELHAYVLDERMQLAPIGVPGMLFVGRQLAEGALYGSGELARYTAEGILERLGPLERQVELRGHRIRLGEIEAALQSHPGVRECAVVVREDEPGERELVAYVAPHQDLSRPTSGELEQYLAQRLPDYLLPSRFVRVATFQLDESGTIDYQALPRPEVEPEDTTVQSEGATRGAIEEQLIAIWTELLDPEEVALGTFGDPADGIGIHDDFFALGGHSLLVTQVMSRVQETFGVDLPLADFFESSTIAELAAQIEAAQLLAAGQRQAPPLLPVARTGPLALSFAQERLWFLQQLEEDSAAYVIMGPRRISGQLNIAALERSLGLLVERHESLRTVIVVDEDGHPGQFVLPQVRIELPLDDLSGLPEDEQQRRVQRVADEEMNTPFDLARGPLLRARLLRLGELSFVLLITVHHIASDGWSQGILYRELAAFYTAVCAGQQAQLPALPIQYADYAVWQRDWLRGEVMEAEVAYWREQLAGAPPVLELPTDRPRPPAQSFAGAIYSFSLSPELAAGVRALSQREDATLFMTLLAAFQVLLRYYSGQEDIVVGTPIANRTHIETEGLIGFFVNTLALRADLSGDPTFRELLGRVRQVALGAYTHQELPFEKLVEALQPERSLSHNPLFQVLFALQNMAVDALTLPGAVVEAQLLAVAVSKFDLSLYLSENVDGTMQGMVEYSTDLFEQASIERMVRHYQALLEQLVQEPGMRLSQARLLDAREREQIVAWNSTEVSFANEETHLARLFEEQAARTPEASALIYGDQRMSYRELDRRANQLAHALRARGVGPETRVGLCLEPTPELYVGLLGILKAGGVYVPLDPDYPTERLALMVADSGAPLVVTLSQLRGRLLEGAASFLCLDADREEIMSMAQEPPRVSIHPESLAYVIYTSGSTGRPKGVLATQRATLNRLHWMWRSYPFAADEICCQKTSLSFVDAVWEIFGPLLQGVPTVLISREQLREPRDLVETLSGQRVSRLVLVPSLLQGLLDLDERLGERLPALKLLSCSGEVLTLPLLRRFQQAFPGCTMLNLYGSSEVAADATCYEVPAGSAPATHVSIGRPIANLRVYILDQQMVLLPVGVAGELYIGGAGVARGYQGRADLTAERFLPDPFSSEPGGRLYRTGDRARYLPDGSIEYLGRSDQQIKLHGFRIELEEVAAALRRDGRLREVALQLWHDPAGEPRLVAYLVAGAEPPPTVQELRAGLQRQLPAYMLPALFVFLDQLPLLPNGKLNRQALPAPHPERQDPNDDDQQPQSPVEEALAAIWCEVLHLKHVGRRQSFFELGGDSILTIQVVTRALRQGLQLSARQIFQHQSIAELAAVVEHSDEFDEQEEAEEAQGEFPLADLNPGELGTLASLLGKMSNTEEPSR